MIDIKPKKVVTGNISIARFTEEDYFELLEVFENSKDRLETVYTPKVAHNSDETRKFWRGIAEEITTAVTDIVTHSLALLAFKYDLDDEA